METNTGMAIDSGQASLSTGSLPVTLTARGFSIPGTKATAGDAFMLNETQGIFMLAGAFEGNPHSASIAEMAVSLFPGNIGALLPVMLDTHSVHTAIQSAIASLNKSIMKKMVSHPELSGAGASFVLAMFKDGLCHVTHLGNCRSYLMSGKKMFRLTMDHTYANVHNGDPAMAHEIDFDPNLVVRNIGKRISRPLEIQAIRMKPGYRLIMCSAGFHRIVPEKDMYSILTQNPGIDESVTEFMDRLAAPPAPASAIIVDF